MSDRIGVILAVALMALWIAASPASAQTAPGNAPPPPAPAAADEPSETNDKGGRESPGLPIPRFVSLRTDPINLRTGPGVRYPVEWVYRRRNLPVEVVQEFDTWRRIRDHEGAEGWVHQSMLSGRRTAIVKAATHPLRRTNAEDSDTVASLEAGVIVAVERCPTGAFCRVEVDGLQGWLRRDEVWGVYPDEVVE